MYVKNYSADYFNSFAQQSSIITENVNKVAQKKKEIMEQNNFFYINKIDAWENKITNKKISGLIIRNLSLPLMQEYLNKV